MKQFNDDELTEIPTARPAAPSATISTQTTTVSPLPPQPVQAPPPPPPPPPPSSPAQATAPPSAITVDDMEDIPTGSTQTKPGTQASAHDDIAGEEVGWGDAELMKKGDGLDRIRPEKKSDKVIRLSLLADLPPRGHRSHYVVTKEGKSNRLCLATKENPVGFCCKQLDEEGRYHVVSLAIEYLNCNPRTGNYDKLGPDGKPDPVNGKVAVPEVKLGYIDLSRPNYRQVSGLTEEGESIYDYDIVMTLNSNKYDFAVKSRKARWKMYPEVAAAVKDAVKRFTQDGGSKLAKKLGRKTSLLEWKALLAMAAAGAAEASLDDVDAL